MVRRWWRRDLSLPDGWEDVTAGTLPHWAVLDDDERARLAELMGWLLHRKRWEAANGFNLNDEIRLTIAAQASLLVLGLSADYYRKVSAIIVHPTTVTMTGVRAGPVPGVVTEAPLPILGRAHLHWGPVIVAWDAARFGARHPDRGHNVVFHEFAHKLDMLDNIIDGTPPMVDQATQERWVEVCTREYQLLRSGRGGELLSGYAAVNPGEFFAVATEVFFTRSREMRAQKPDLYEVLSGFYRQDPAGRQRFR